ncbi:hypothetical protein CkaCkLH20_03549 [Colletotrichum karsti]|uniref:Uncharacterized protein n=1 Tax=Colletotrichum karsti TaxID=1095194 RepID=A0A9P6LNK5_9PEZI|nr:uncharacterized protein CkaCkLH20_03549 [Colletotrichum karsti]KAF9879316.1 hypothetical protein CkaCkLH20_03549 [Colletotrichum karsti]
MSDFPKLIPAFTVRVHLGTPSPIGTLAHGPSQLHAPFLPDSGSLVSEPTYPLRVDAVFLHGSDYLRFDPDGRHARLEVSSALKDKGGSGAVIRFDYTGVIDVSGPAGAVLKGLEGAATTGFGDAFTQVKFESGHETLRELQNKIYVGSGRFVLEEGKPTVVEYKISEVAA